MKWSSLTPLQRNALVAEKVMELKVRWLDVVPSLPPVAVIVDENEIIKGNTPDYCEDMNAAWQIVEKLYEQFNVRIEVMPQNNYKYTVQIYDYHHHIMVGNAVSTISIQEALCLAALIACGADIKS